MLIKESQFSKRSNILDQLNEAVYLTEEESTIHPTEISVYEMSRLGKGSAVVSYNDVERFAESNNISFYDSLSTIAEASEVDASKMTVAVDEADLIADPKMVHEMGSYVVIPVSENDIVYQACSEAVNAYLENEDESLLEAFVNEGIGDLVKKVREKKEAAKQAGAPTPVPVKSSVTESKVGEIGKKLMKAGAATYAVGQAGGFYSGYKAGQDMKNNGTDEFDALMNHSGKLAASSAVADIGGTSFRLGAGMFVGDKLYNHFKNKPKNAISKGIASLRKLMAKLKNKMAGNSILPKQKNMLQKAVNKIGEVIDKLLAKLQSGANKLSGSSSKLSIKVG